MVVLPAASRPTYNTSFVELGLPRDPGWSVSNCVPSKSLQKTRASESNGSHMTRKYNHVRISFLPRRAANSEEKDKPMVGVKC